MKGSPLNSSAIKQKGQSQKGCYKKTKQAKFSKKKYFLPPDTLICVCVSGGKECSFFGKFGVLCFLVTLFLRFALLPYCRRIHSKHFVAFSWLQQGSNTRTLNVKPSTNQVVHSIQQILAYSDILPNPYVLNLLEVVT